MTLCVLTRPPMRNRHRSKNLAVDAKIRKNKMQMFSFKSFFDKPVTLESDFLIPFLITDGIYFMGHFHVFIFNISKAYKVNL